MRRSGPNEIELAATPMMGIIERLCIGQAFFTRSSRGLPKVLTVHVYVTLVLAVAMGSYPLSNLAVLAIVGPRKSGKVNRVRVVSWFVSSAHLHVLRATGV